MRIKQILKFVWNEFVYGGHLISLGAVSVVFASAILLNIPVTWDFLIIAYFITYTVYLYNRLNEFKEDFLTNPERTRHIKGYIKHVPCFIFFCTMIIVAMLMYFGNLLSMAFGLLLLLFGLLYSLIFKKITQKIIGFKNFYVAFIWTLLIVFLAVYYSFSMNLSIFLILAFVYLRCFMGTSFYDIKDIKSDEKENLLTLPIILKKKIFIRFLNIINILALLPIIIGVYLELLPRFSAMLFLVIPVAFYFLRKLENKKENLPYLSEIAIGLEKISWSIFILLGIFLL